MSRPNERVRAAAFWWLASVFLPYTLAASTDLGPAFDWSLTADPENTNTTLLSCYLYDIQINGFPAGNQTPPYQMSAFAPQAVPTTSLLGSSTLSWRALFPVGTELLLNVIDNNKLRGTVSNLTNVKVNDIEVFNPPCNPQLGTSGFQVSANTTQPSSCDPVRLTISGGVRPFTIVIAVEGKEVIQQLMGGKDSLYTWYNPFPNGLHVIASAMDINGNLAQSSEIIWFADTSSSPCPQRLSFSGLPKKLSKGAIAGIAVGSFFGLCLVVGSLVFLYKRCCTKQPDEDIPLEASPEPPTVINPGPWNPTAVEEAEMSVRDHPESGA